MADIVELIFEDHQWFRRQFADLDELRAQSPRDCAALEAVWKPLARRLDVHAVAEEEIFYPQLLRVGDDARPETLDAIGDHNDIRDGVHDAEKHAVGDAQWWAAVRRAREANDEHMAEEEREGLADFRRTATAAFRDALGRRFAAYLSEHRTADDIDTSDIDPEGYVEEVAEELSEDEGHTGSLRIGSMKDRGTRRRVHRDA
ncbi:hemerythrin domain-containing protein [Rhodococcus sp. NPDC058521]|uniref:hemerythrin domain-containing protein n=1 Tax=Rhodococcus sp. NPDC058521 TaxID=3346536 RepID=UPI003662608D